ncbi:ubiquinol-cytochrome c reductase iron-sulfur subunit [Marinimicrobium sp. C6131]|uniref:ubiquinol-cytochrome c reductase iron-sulfur subunit n=1 Tax=Marinimicrobium sp. C6131 TaxID=3022676 RepID=UPI00223D046D|nr:ubiquinol-cytochrome c reductase iron-sulfur subunit [Marinimicrobium sp. C6131]UZJ44835.1 ubiquinol-cytochrome c reductase iron-sulfur subunit [Marinimicrobium sp. C6131]
MTDDVVNKTRRRVLTAATSVVGAVGVVGAAVPFVGSWNPSAKAKAAGAPVRANIGKMEPGQMITVEWRGKPVYIVRRTPEAIKGLKKVVERDLVRDPNSEQPQQPEYAQNETRSIRDEFLVLLGLCTHLGCAPLFRPEVGAADLGGEDWLGGFFCPCHGSKFDMAGRVYTGVPAPLNLEVPPHRYEGDNLLIVGEDQEA